MIDALYFPSSPSRSPVTVAVDEHDVRLWYPFVSGGPVEAAYFVFPQFGGHALYVNSRYAQFEESRENPRASRLLASFGIGMECGAIRGDALLVAEEPSVDRLTSMDRHVLTVLANVL